MDMLPTNMNLEQARSLQNGHRLQQLQQQYLNPSNQDQAKLKKAAQEFEAIFVQQLMDAMEQTVDRSASMLNSSGEDYFRGMMNQHIATSMSTRAGGSGFGIAEAIYKQAAQALPIEGGNPVNTNEVKDAD